MKDELDRASKELERVREKLRREYEENDPRYAFGLFGLLHMWQTTGRASLGLTKEQVTLVYDALALDIGLHYLPPFKPPREPYELILGADAVLRLMTDGDYDSSRRIDNLEAVLARLSIMMLMEEQIRDCKSWPCVVELDGYSLTVVSGALIVQQMEHSPGWPLLELNQTTKKLVDDTMTMMP